MKTHNVAKKMQIAAGTSLILFPVMIMVAMTFVPGFPFSLQKPPTEPTVELARIAEYFSKPRLLPLQISHMFSLFAIPFAIATALYFSKMLSEHKPYLASIGGALSVIGAVAMGAIMGRSLAALAIASVPIPEALTIIKVLITPTPFITIVALISILLSLGFVILGVGSFINRDVPRLSSVALVIGPLSLIIFRENAFFVFLGFLVMLIGLLPLSMKLFKHENIEPK